MSVLPPVLPVKHNHITRKMGSSAMSDFNLDSEGHCFFCLNKIPLKDKQDPELLATLKFQNNSVHYLARYLGMDMGKVLIEEGQRDPVLLTKLRKSRLKVELCEKCTGLNKAFSGLYRQVEKLEIEISSSLRLIQEKLLGGDGDRSLSDHQATRHLHKSMNNELAQIVDVLRDEAIQKCSQKLLDIGSPQIKIEKLTKKQIDAGLVKHQPNSTIAKRGPATSPKRLQQLQGNIKREFDPPIKNLLSEDLNNSRSYDMGDNNELMDDDHDNQTNPLHTTESDNNVVTEPEQEVNTSLLVIDSAQSTSVTKVGKGHHSINPKTKKWKCSSCPSEFASISGVKLHYQSVHQKIRYKCVPCGKEFVQKHVYDRHHQGVHVGVRFKCLVCNKLFSQKDNLLTHQRRKTCGEGGR